MWLCQTCVHSAGSRLEYRMERPTGGSQVGPRPPESHPEALAALYPRARASVGAWLAMRWMVRDLQGEEMIPLHDRCLEAAREICQFLRGSCESLMESTTRIGRERKATRNKTQRAENNCSSQQNTRLREGKSHFSIAHACVPCKVVERPQDWNRKGACFCSVL